VLASYGTGAIMAVPASDTRDYAFAKTFGLPIVEVVAGGDPAVGPHEEEGTAVNSGFLNGLPTAEAKDKMTAWLEEHGVGKRAVSYKLRDWLFSRQRYWGEPFPVVHGADGAVSLVPESRCRCSCPSSTTSAARRFQAPLARGDWVVATRRGAPAARHHTMPRGAAGTTCASPTRTTTASRSRARPSATG
jgi:leucyl-tRNA synthetase